MFSKRPLLVVAVLLPVVVPALAGCAPNHGAAGVEVVESRRVGTVDEPVVATLPSAIGTRDSDAGAGDQGDASAVVAEVRPAEILDEPTIDWPATVAVVGDSLTRSAENEIVAALTADGLDVLVVDAIESRRMTHGGSAVPPGTEAIENIQAVVEPDLWVIALGTNDVASLGSADGFRAEMQSVLTLLPVDAPVVWVDLWIRDRTAPIGEANRLIRDELRAWRGGAAVVDWYSHGDDDGIITGDGVHLTESGRQLFAASISAAIDDLFAS